MPHVICIVSDFFYPGYGGIETHIFNLSQMLIKLGHKVVIVTYNRHAEGRGGVRYMTNGLKVYYLPLFALKFLAGSVTLPTAHPGMFPLLRQIVIRERVDIVHGHQTTSSMCHHAMFHACTMGVPTVFTDHSLFGFADLASILINKVLGWSMCHVGHVVCVSHTCKENTALRGTIPPERVSVIPNATDPAIFYPDPEYKGRRWGEILETEKRPVTIVVVSRLVYRKGADLLADVIPKLHKTHPEVRWVIAGDGPRALQIKQVVERHNLFHTVDLVGPVPNEHVPGVLRRGSLFLNMSLTDSFCIAICEAAACGHLVVATRVGGVPEVMPDDMMLLADPEPESILTSLKEALVRLPDVDPWDHHARIKKFYNWTDIARRTVKVYDKVLKATPPSVSDRIYRDLSLGLVFGVICAGLTAIDHLVWTVLKLLFPADKIDPAVDMPGWDVFNPPPDGSSRAQNARQPLRA
eukprot:TRINITY_DN12075_c0_g2_i1.p1 TRINITY_DN12075_c0_g2~~TRINITY_DN12075_c0_g2_i1.p1  ORF type:complete len:466 (+),score=170.18 TRINITY_DN12075_c0_g2_i1:130-1527(+)